MVDDQSGADAAPVNPRASRRRLLVVLVVVVAGVAVAGSQTRWFGLRPDPREAVAIDRCEDAVRHDLAVPDQAHFDRVRARVDIVTEDDHVRLGFDASKVAAMWGVSGSVASPGRSGQPATLEFACRAAFFEGRPVTASVNYGSADLSGQLGKRS
ncbi:hypothetical protein ACNO8X_26535 [Mycobacterium sp. PDNC021]|uniref:hypothetical protein n=1 Tax=Mycobacterium sp. PDNC021 TaxID=3391399 RepID=UPI003AADCFFF